MRNLEKDVNYLSSLSVKRCRNNIDQSSEQYFNMRRDRKSEEIGSRKRTIYTTNPTLTSLSKSKKYIGKKGLNWLLSKRYILNDNNNRSLIFTYRDDKDKNNIQYKIDKEIITTVLHIYRKYNAIGEIIRTSDHDIYIIEIGRLVNDKILLHNEIKVFKGLSPLKKWTDHIYNETGGSRGKLTNRNTQTGWNFVKPIHIYENEKDKVLIYDNNVKCFTLLDIKRKLLTDKLNRIETIEAIKNVTKEVEEVEVIEKMNAMNAIDAMDAMDAMEVTDNIQSLDLSVDDIFSQLT